MLLARWPLPLPHKLVHAYWQKVAVTQCSLLRLRGPQRWKLQGVEEVAEETVAVVVAVPAVPVVPVVVVLEVVQG